MLTALLLATAVRCPEASPGLAARAKVSCAAATMTAKGRVPGAAVKSAELEEEGGRLVYSFDLKRRGADGVEEVQVDARTGEVVAVSHEDAAAESAERSAEHGKK